MKGHGTRLVRDTSSRRCCVRNKVDQYGPRNVLAIYIASGFHKTGLLIAAAGWIKRFHYLADRTIH